ncbi:MAG: LysM peptidoglycan-binding domain-containing protein [Verrucomicrobiota bacterium]
MLAVHVFLLAGLLIQGCKRQDAGPGASTELTNSVPAFSAPVPSNDTAVATQSVPPPATQTIVTPPAATANPAPELPAAGTVATPTTSPRAAETVDRLRSTPAPDVAVSEAGSEGPVTNYVVKAGDNLTRIAKAHHTTTKAIRAANNLKTDRILVGQKLKVPQGIAAPTAKP